MKIFYPMVLFAFEVFAPESIMAQAPAISYTSPQPFTVAAPIVALLPTNTGGVVPATVYGQVTTFAGSGVPGSFNGVGISSTFYQPYASAIDGSGNLYVADGFNHLIRKITSSGVVTTFAGSGYVGASNGIASSASFNYPGGIAIDAVGNIYVGDQTNNLIRKITVTGVVSTFAGTGALGANNGSAGSASFSDPAGLAFDGSGNLYVADRNNNMIRKITPSGLVSTLAGSGFAGSANGVGSAASFSGCAGVATDQAGNVYVADWNNNQIRKITPAGVVTSFAGTGSAGAADGPGLSATFYEPFGLTVDVAGNVFVADEFNNSIRRISPSGAVTTLAGNGSIGSTDGTGANATFYHPTGVALDGIGNLFVTENLNNKIRKICITGYTIDKTLPAGLVFDPTTGKISGTPTMVSPATDYTVTAYNLAGSSSAIINIAVLAPAPPNISYVTPQVYTVAMPISPLAPTNTGGAVPATAYRQVTTIAGNGAQSFVNGPVATASFYHPYTTVMDKSGNLYVADCFNHVIRKITSAGIVSTCAGSGFQGASDGLGSAASFNYPGGLAIDAAGNIFVGDQTNNLIRKITPAGQVTTFAGTGIMGATNGNAASATFNGPNGLAFDAAGNLFVADRNNNMIRKITPAGVVSTFAGSGATGAVNGTALTASFSGCSGLAFDQAGNMYVADCNNQMIRKITTGALVSTLAGNGTIGATDGNGNVASFYQPFNVDVDLAGNVYVGDGFNNKVRMITPAGIVTTLAGTGVAGATDGAGNIATFNDPAGVILDAAGNLMVTETLSAKIRKISLTGYTIDKALPTGLSFDPTSGIITGTPTAISPSTVYTVTAYNVGGSSSTTLTISVISPQIITFNPIPAKIYGTADFSPAATASSGLPVSYNSGNLSVATITAGGSIHITGVGTTTITASQSGNANYAAAPSVSQTLTVTPAQLTITADNKTKAFGAANPTLTASFSGFVYGETFSSLTTQPTLITSASSQSPAGTYPINVTGAVDPNYAISYIQGTLTVLAPIDSDVVVFPVVTPNGDGINDVLRIKGIGSYPGNRLVIVNRNGAKIYDASGYNNSTIVFDGHSNITGIFEQQGTYFYVLQYVKDGQNKRQTGFIVLKY